MNIVEEKWIRENVREKQGLDSARVAFGCLGNQAVMQPPVMQLQFPDHHGETCIKSAHLRGRDVAAVKVASGFYKNVEKGLPNGSGLMMLLDATTGIPLALLRDGGYLTDLRTGAAAALGVDLLCAKDRVLPKVAILGSGIIARFALRAISGVREWDSVCAFSRTKSNLDAFAAEMSQEFSRPVAAASSAEVCVTDADLIITTTTSTSALVEAKWVKAGATIIAMGSDTPGKQELSPDVLNIEGCKYVCDSKSQCERLGELQHAKGISVHGELGEVLNGKVTGRENDTEVIICDLTGCGAQDAAIAEMAFRAFQGKN